MNNQKHSDSSLPLSPQLRSSVMHKQPRTTVPLSRKLSQPPPLPPPPASLGSDYDRLVPVLSCLCVDYIVSIESSYISRDKLLRKMYRRRIRYRTFISKDMDSQRTKEGILILGPPLDCWFTFPLQYSQESKLLYGPEDSEEGTVLVRGCQVKSSREMVIKDIGFGPLPNFNRLTFPWVTNISATKFRSLKELMNPSNNRKCRIDGLVECIKCGEIFGIGYHLLKRVDAVVEHIFQILELATDNETIMRSCPIPCLCEGNPNPRVPIISENSRKINWMFLFCGISLGYCTEEQLRYFCNQRKLDSSGNKNALLRQICIDLSMQIKPSKP